MQGASRVLADRLRFLLFNRRSLNLLRFSGALAITRSIVLDLRDPLHYRSEIRLINLASFLFKAQHESVPKKILHVNPLWLEHIALRVAAAELDAHIFGDFPVEDHHTRIVFQATLSTQLVIELVIAILTFQSHLFKQDLRMSIEMLLVLTIQQILLHGCACFLYLDALF